MHELLWFEDEHLRDVVIVDPVTYFVKPAALIIRRHIGTADDPTVHTSPIHKQCSVEMPCDFHDMATRGVVTNRLLRRLLELGECSDRVKMIVLLMIRFGLLVPRTSTRSEHGALHLNCVKH